MPEGGRNVSKKICPILMLAVSIEGLKPMQRTGDEEIAECRKEKCAWWNINEQCAIYTGLMAIEQMFGKMI